MAGFQTFDLANVLQAAEAIKAQRRQPAEDALRNRVLTAQAAQAEQSTVLQKQQADAQMDETKAHRAYNASVAVLSSANPKAAAESLAPDFVQNWDQTHGAGSWKNLTPEQAVQAAKAIQDHALTIIGPQVEVEWKDTGGQLVAYDKKTAQPISGATPIAKTATPDATLSAQTSTANAELSANTTLRGQDIAAFTARRGQDIGAQTAAAGQAVTTRGQDLTAETAKATQGQKMTETQGNAKAFGLRATAANTALETMLNPKDKGGEGYSPSALGFFRDQHVTGSALTNWMASSEGRRYLNQAEGFIAPILRKESGAAISDSERENAFKLYIPMPGDDDKQLALKAANRRNAVRGLDVQAGPGGIPAPEGGKTINFADLPD